MSEALWKRWREWRQGPDRVQAHRVEDEALAKAEEALVPVEFRREYERLCQMTHCRLGRLTEGPWRDQDLLVDPLRLLSHQLAIGDTGAGKTQHQLSEIIALLRLSLTGASDLKSVFALDMKGEQTELLTERALPALAASLPAAKADAFLQRIVVIDPFSSSHLPPLNVLARDPAQPIAIQARDVAECFEAATETEVSVRMETVLDWVLRLVIEVGGSFLTVRRALQEPAVLEGLVRLSKDTDVIRYFLNRYPAEPKASKLALLARLDRFLALPMTKLCLGAKGCFDVPVQLNEAAGRPSVDEPIGGPLTRGLILRRERSSPRGVTDAERITELEKTLHQRDQRIAELERTVGDLTKTIEAWKRGHRVRPGGKIAQKSRDKAHTKGRGPGRPKGHEGTSRPAPTVADRDVMVPAPETCACGGIIDPTGEEPGEPFVEELIPARTEVIRFRRCKGRCRDCKAPVLAPLPDGLGANPKIGVRAQAEIVESKTELGLTLGQTKKLFERQGLTLSRGGIQQILHRSAEVLTPGHDALKAEIPKAEVAWADESTHKVDGASGYLWLVMTPNVVLYEADRSRGQEVAQRLFEGFTGTLHSDFYAVYWTLEGISHAVCWGHICREARQIAERQPESVEAVSFHDRLSGLYGRAAAAQQRPETAERNARAIKGDLKALALDEALTANVDVARLQKRILKHLPEMVAFITNPALEGTNNRAEREFRPHAIGRHRSGGARSDEGARTYAINLSVVRTVHHHDGDFLDIFRQARIAFHGGSDFPRLFPDQADQHPEPPLPH